MNSFYGAVAVIISVLCFLSHRSLGKINHDPVIATQNRSLERRTLSFSNANEHLQNEADSVVTGSTLFRSAELSKGAEASKVPPSRFQSDSLKTSSVNLGKSKEVAGLSFPQSHSAHRSNSEQAHLSIVSLTKEPDVAKQPMIRVENPSFGEALAPTRTREAAPAKAKSHGQTLEKNFPIPKAHPLSASFMGKVRNNYRNLKGPLGTAGRESTESQQAASTSAKISSPSRNTNSELSRTQQQTLVPLKPASPKIKEVSGNVPGPTNSLRWHPDNYEAVVRETVDEAIENALKREELIQLTHESGMMEIIPRLMNIWVFDKETASEHEKTKIENWWWNFLKMPSRGQPCTLSQRPVMGIYKPINQVTDASGVKGNIRWFFFEVLAELEELHPPGHYTGNYRALKEAMAIRLLKLQGRKNLELLEVLKEKASEGLNAFKVFTEELRRIDFELGSLALRLRNEPQSFVSSTGWGGAVGKGHCELLDLALRGMQVLWKLDTTRAWELKLHILEKLAAATNGNPMIPKILMFLDVNQHLLDQENLPFTFSRFTIFRNELLRKVRHGGERNMSMEPDLIGAEKLEEFLRIISKEMAGLYRPEMNIPKSMQNWSTKSRSWTIETPEYLKEVAENVPRHHQPPERTSLSASSSSRHPKPRTFASYLKYIDQTLPNPTSHQIKKTLSKHQGKQNKSRKNISWYQFPWFEPRNKAGAPRLSSTRASDAEESSLNVFKKKKSKTP